MFATVTVKIEANSKGELAETFPGAVKMLREHLDGLWADGAFGPPDQVEVRYLVIGGKWREPAQQQPPERKKSKEPKKPDVK